MTELFIYLALTAIQILATKSQPGPKAATLKEFDVPVSEDGRELAVIFGRVRLKDFNVVWHGDLYSKEIRKRMGFKKQTVAFDYWLKAHLALCIGPINKAGNATYNKKKLKENGPGDNEVVDIPIGGLEKYLGEDKYFKNGILQGTNTYSGRVRYNAGHDTQAVPPQWKDKPDNNAYRGVVTVDLFQNGGAGANWTGKRGGYIGQAARVNLMTFDLERTSAGWMNDAVWYIEKLEINRAAPAGYQAYKEFNPAHMLYEVITNNRWGMGGDPQLIDDTNWRAMADILYNEQLGLSLEWAKSQSIGQFIDKVCDHIRGGVRFNESVGKFQLVLFRNDYDVGTLPVYNTGNSKLLKYAAAGNVERVNEVSLKYTDVRTFELATITAHDMGAQMAQQASIPVTVVREGITDAATARMVLGWELHARVAPLSTIQISADRRARGLGYSGVFIYTEPTHHATPRVYRATKVVNSEVDKNQIIIDAVADIFAQQVGGWTIGTPQLPDVPPDPADPSDPDDDDAGAVVVDTSLTAPPVSPVPGGTYVPAPGATGAWAGHEGESATFEPGPGEGGGSWTFEPIPDHSLIFDEAANGGAGEWYEYVGGVRFPAPWDLRQILTTKGDLLVRTNDGLARFPVGPDGQAIVADSATAEGVKYAFVSGGGGGSAAPGNSVDYEIMVDVPRAYWKCDEVSGNISDYSGNAYHLTPVGAVAYRRGAITYGDNGEYLRIPPSLGTIYASRAGTLGLAQPINGSWTICAIVRLEDLQTTNNHRILVMGASGETEAANYQVYFFVTPNGALGTFWEYGAGTDFTFTSVRSAIPRGVPVHIAMRKNVANRTLQFYINGALIDETTWTAGQDVTGGTSCSTAIGDAFGAGNSGFTIAHLAIFNTLLTPARILAQASAAGFRSGSDSLPSPKNHTKFEDDFFGGVDPGNGTPWLVGTSGGTVTNVAVTDHPGVYELTTGTSGGGYSTILLGGSSALTRTWTNSTNKTTVEFIIRVPNIPTALEQFIARLGPAEALTGSLNRIQFGFRWDTVSASCRWDLQTQSAGSLTTTTATTGPASNTWYHCLIDITTTTVTAYVNGVQVATTALTIPSAAVGMSPFMCFCLKNSGSANNAVQLDWMRYTQVLANRW